jgi:hypothetical protein
LMLNVEKKKSFSRYMESSIVITRSKRHRDPAHHSRKTDSWIVEGQTFLPVIVIVGVSGEDMRSALTERVPSSRTTKVPMCHAPFTKPPKVLSIPNPIRHAKCHIGSGDPIDFSIPR